MREACPPSPDSSGDIQQRRELTVALVRIVTLAFFSQPRGQANDLATVPSGLYRVGDGLVFLAGSQRFTGG